MNGNYYIYIYIYIYIKKYNLWEVLRIGREKITVPAFGPAESE